MIKLTVRQLEYFDALAQTLHFGKAAAAAGASQPALSAQIAEMEKRLGCRLFERGGKAVRMTDEAQAMQPKVERLLAELREIERMASQGRDAMEGRFRLGIIPTVAPYLLPRILPKIRERFPKLELELREAVTDRLIEETTARRLDAFIAANPLDGLGLETEDLFADRFFLAVPEGDPAFASPPVPPESPALERLMLLEEGHCLREQALSVCGSVKPVAMASYGATSLTTLLQMVSHGMGVTLVPEMAAEAASAMRDLKILPFAEPMPERTICLAWRKNSARQEDCQALAAVIRDVNARSAR
jgi:LysR family hydrogen peroxide-inducible transcriptional activator